MIAWAGKMPSAGQWRDIIEAHARWDRGEKDGQCADLRYADLRDANLRGANLRGADLRGANLRDADLRYANLRYANLRSADLRDANLRDADLRDANLRDANLQGANLRDAKNADLAIAMTRILPEGDLIGWKKCDHEVIVKLRIPADAKRSHAFGRKCRAEFVDVLEVVGAKVGITDRTDQGGAKAEYRAGQRTVADSWDDDFSSECSHGLHFFITRLEAEMYR